MKEICKLLEGHHSSCIVALYNYKQVLYEYKKIDKGVYSKRNQNISNVYDIQKKGGSMIFKLSQPNLH